MRSILFFGRRKVCSCILFVFFTLSVATASFSQELSTEQSIDQKLDKAFDEIVRNDFRKSRDVIAILKKELGNHSNPLIRETQLAESEMLEAVAYYLDDNTTLFEKGKSFLLFQNASRRFIRNWRPENMAETPSLEELLCLKRTLDRLQRAPKKHLGKLPNEFINYLMHACNDAGRLFMDRSFIEARECFEASLFFLDSQNSMTAGLERTRISIHSSLSVALNHAGLSYLALDHAKLAVGLAENLSADQRDDADVAVWRINLGAVYEELGDFESAKSQYLDAIHLMEQAKLLSIKESPEIASVLASGLSHLASVEVELGRPEDAVRKYHQVIDQKVLSNSPPLELVRTYHNVAAAYAACSLNDHAIYWFNRSLEAKLQAYPLDKFPFGHVSIGRTLHLLSELHLRTGDIYLAEMYSLDAIHIRQASYSTDVFPNGHDELVESWLLWGRIQLAQGRTAEAKDSIAYSVEMAIVLAEQALLFATLNDSVKLMDQVNRVRDYLLSLPDELVDDTRTVYDIVWDSKGLVSRMLRDRSIFLSRSSDPDVNLYRRKNEDLSDKISRLVTSDAVNSDEKKLMIMDLRDEHRNVSLKLRSLIDARSPPEKLSFRDLQRLLKNDEVLVDIVQSRSQFNFSREIPGNYYAFVLCSGDLPPGRIDLGPPDELEPIIMDFVQSIREQKEAYRATGILLSERVWSKINAAFLGDSQVNRVYIAPDGVFDLLPWDALPSTKGADFLIEDVAFTHVIHGSLLTEQLIHERNLRDKGSIDAMVVGQVDFGDSPSLKPADTLAELPDSEQEVKCFEDVFREAGVSSILKLTGDNAQVEEVVEKLKRTQYAHFATHMISGISKSRRSSDSVKQEYLSIEVAGIALANSNLSNDGILRASRIAALPLGNTCMVNLAGCFSAAGDPSLREIGVSSLEHAFQLAGVQVTVSSKWEVDSTITSYLMSDFYMNLFRHQVIDVSSSLRAAKIRTMRQGPASDSGHPFYWAGWQVTGSPFLQINRPEDLGPSLDDFQGGATSTPVLVGDQGRNTNSQNFRWSYLRFLMQFRIPIAIVLLFMSGSLYLAASWNR